MARVRFSSPSSSSQSAYNLLARCRHGGFVLEWTMENRKWRSMPPMTGRDSISPRRKMQMKRNEMREERKRKKTCCSFAVIATHQFKRKKVLFRLRGFFSFFSTSTFFSRLLLLSSINSFLRVNSAQKSGFPGYILFLFFILGAAAAVVTGELLRWQGLRRRKKEE